MRTENKNRFHEWISNASEMYFIGWVVHGFSFCLVRLCSLVFFFWLILFFNNGMDSDLYYISFFSSFFWKIGFKRRNRSRNYCSNRGMLGKIFFVLSVYYRSIIIFFFSVLFWFLMCLLRNSLWFIEFIIQT